MQRASRRLNLASMDGHRLAAVGVLIPHLACFAKQGIALGPLPLMLIGSQLRLGIGGVDVERREFAGGEVGYREAQQAGGA